MLPFFRYDCSRRDDYERIARELRYSAYRDLLAAREGTGAGIFFGHHQGDLQENVISNVMRGCSPLQLAGMAEASSSHGVLVWRPLLSHTKEEIFAFAHKYGVPYFRDTTPSWSTRGKLRRQLLPLLHEMYGEGFLRNLSALASASDSNRELLEGSLYDPFLSSVRRHRCGLRVPIKRWVSQPECFWAEMLRRLMHSMSMSMVRDSSVTNFVAFIHKRYSTCNESLGQIVWLELRKGFFTFLSPTGDLVIFKDGVFTGFHDEAVDVSSLPTTDGVKLGSWCVDVKVEECTDENEYEIKSWEDILEGSFSYVIRPRSECQRLVLIGSDDRAAYLGGAKAKKRSSSGEVKVIFRNLDKKFRDSIPFLVEADAALNFEYGDKGCTTFQQLRLAYRSFSE